MSAGNLFETERKAFDLRTKVITSSTGVVTYTARVGGASDNFIVDRVIQVTTTSGNAMAIAVPKGKYAGQQLLVVCVVSGGGADNITTVVTCGDNITPITGTGGWGILLWIDDTNGWVAMAGSAA